MKKELLTDFQVDQLKEIMNIGASHASNALSQMVKQKIALTIPSAHVDETKNIKKYFPKSNVGTKSAFIKIYGDIEGVMYFIFSHENENRLIDLLLGGIKSPVERKELESSVVEEVGNILAGASLTAFSNFMGLTLLHSISKVVVDSVEEMETRINTELKEDDGVAIIFQIDFNINHEEISTHFLFFIDSEATDKILVALQNKYL